MLVDLTKPTTFQHSRRHHKAYGIQHWLAEKGYCRKPDVKRTLDKEAYEQLLADFCEDAVAPDIRSAEAYVSANFKAFCLYCITKFNK